MLRDVQDHIEGLEARLPRDQLAPTLESLGRELPDGAEGRAEYLSSAADWYVAAARDDLAAYADARRCLEDARADGGETTIDVDVQLVDLLLRLDDTEALDATVERLRHRTRELDDLDLKLVAESFEEAGRLKDAHRWFTVVVRDVDPDEIEYGHPAYPAAVGRRRVRQALGLPSDRFDEAVARSQQDLLSRDPDEDGPERPAVDLAVLYWPPAELARFAERWPEVAEGYGSAEEHRASIRKTLREYADLGTSVSVASGPVEEYAAYCADRDLDPEQSASRGAYSAELGRTGRARPWPPGRNEPCWCGSGLKFKRCCGRPGV